MKPYINPNVTHQRKQAPVVYRAYYDDGSLIADDAVPMFHVMTFAELRETYGSWLSRMQWLAERRQSISNRKKLNGGEEC